MKLELSVSMTFLTVLFVVLKLTGSIDWSWFWVLSPIWIAAIIWIIVWAIIFIAGMAITNLFKRRY